LRIKGNFLKDYVKLVNDNPDMEWDKYLTDSDWQIVRSIIIPSAWYPVETMGRIGRGIFEMRSKRNYEAVRAHGRARAIESFDEATKRFLIKADPASSIQAYTMIVRRYVDEVSVELEKSEAGRAEVCFYPVDDAPSWDLFREIQAGTLEQLVELNGGKDAHAEFLSELREGREACIISLTWSQD